MPITQSSSSARVLIWRAPVRSEAAVIDVEGAERAAEDFLRALGQPIGSEGMAETPR